MLRDETNLSNKYFEWMYQLVCNDQYYDNLSYYKLLRLLYDIEFTYSIEKDENRAMDGIEFRYRFGFDCDYSRDVIKEFLDTGPCSILEMMISLAFRTEESIMDDITFGNRTGQWFWNMIVNLGLGNMSDSKFNERRIRGIIDKFVNREYKPNGQGGLFTANNPQYDMRSVEIWFQMMWYLDENYDFSI